MVTNHLQAPASRKNRMIFINFLNIVRCPVNFRYYRYLKFHGGRTAFGRVNKGTLGSHRPFGVRPAPGRRLHTSDDFCLKYKSYISNGDRPGIVQCLGTGRCFMCQTFTGEKRHVLQKYTLHLHRYCSSKDQKHKYKTKLTMVINMQRTSAIETFVSLEKVWFSSQSL